jgi:hypothetical protein
VESVVIVYERFVFTSRIVTVAPATTAPVASVTIPVIVPVAV